MKNKTLLVLLGNHLFPTEDIIKVNADKIFMAEDFGLCTYEKHHKLKILMFLTAMREKRDELNKFNLNVDYWDINHPKFNKTFEEKLASYINSRKITKIKIFEIEDKAFESRMKAFAKSQKKVLEIITSPMFLVTRKEFSIFKDKSKNLLMANFYKEMRKRYKVLLDIEGKPLGGKWSLDQENRKRIPRGEPIPKQFKPKESNYIINLKQKINEKFADHPGAMDNVWMPVTRVDALHSLDYFLWNKFEKFGVYEDAILNSDNFLFHSSLSSSLNMGLITPRDILTKTLSHIERSKIPINSIEGFLRQVLGWREFIRGIYQEYSEIQQQRNYFNFSRCLKNSWYNAKTGIPPLDDAIAFTVKYGFTHHINRLMVISNIMTLCEVDPKIIYRWFMEMFIDSSEWVMTPNVFGMGTFSDGGIFSTKPYICGSNYILKMSDYKKGEWCAILDGLYWRFVAKHMELLKRNPRMPFLRKTLNNMDVDRKNLIFDKAESFIAINCC